MHVQIVGFNSGSNVLEITAFVFTNIDNLQDEFQLK